MKLKASSLGPTEGAINPNRQTDARCAKRSTPLAGRVSSGRRTNVNINRRTGPRTRDLCQTSSIRPVLLAEDQRQTPHRQRSLLGDAKVNPCNRDHAPRLSRVGNRGESQTVPLLLPDPFVAEYALEAIRSKPVYPVHIYVTKTSTKVHTTPVRRSGVVMRPITCARART